jgi:hypothetical protein
LSAIALSSERLEKELAQRPKGRSPLDRKSIKRSAVHSRLEQNLSNKLLGKIKTKKKNAR